MVKNLSAQPCRAIRAVLPKGSWLHTGCQPAGRHRRQSLGEATLREQFLLPEELGEGSALPLLSRALSSFLKCKSRGKKSIRPKLKITQGLQGFPTAWEETKGNRSHRQSSDGLPRSENTAAEQCQMKKGGAGGPVAGQSCWYMHRYAHEGIHVSKGIMSVTGQ